MRAEAAAVPPVVETLGVPYADLSVNPNPNPNPDPNPNPGRPLRRPLGARCAQLALLTMALLTMAIPPLLRIY